MYVPKKSRLNGFKQVHVPRACNLFARFGKMSSNIGTSDGVAIPMNMNKLDYMDFVDDYDRMMNERERAGSDASPNGDDNPNTEPEPVSD